MPLANKFTVNPHLNHATPAAEILIGILGMPPSSEPKVERVASIFGFFSRFHLHGRKGEDFPHFKFGLNDFVHFVSQVCGKKYLSYLWSKNPIDLEQLTYQYLTMKYEQAILHLDQPRVPIQYEKQRLSRFFVFTQATRRGFDTFLQELDLISSTEGGVRPDEETNSVEVRYLFALREFMEIEHKLKKTSSESIFHAFISRNPVVVDEIHRILKHFSLSMFDFGLFFRERARRLYYGKLSSEDESEYRTIPASIVVQILFQFLDFIIRDRAYRYYRLAAKSVPSLKIEQASIFLTDYDLADPIPILERILKFNMYNRGSRGWLWKSKDENQGSPIQELIFEEIYRHPKPFQDLTEVFQTYKDKFAYFQKILIDNSVEMLAFLNTIKEKHPRVKNDEFMIKLGNFVKDRCKRERILSLLPSHLSSQHVTLIESLDSPYPLHKLIYDLRYHDIQLLSLNEYEFRRKYSLPAGLTKDQLKTLIYFVFLDHRPVHAAGIVQFLSEVNFLSKVISKGIITQLLIEMVAEGLMTTLHPEEPPNLRQYLFVTDGTQWNVSLEPSKMIQGDDHSILRGIVFPLPLINALSTQQKFLLYILSEELKYKDLPLLKKEGIQHYYQTYCNAYGQPAILRSKFHNTMDLLERLDLIYRPTPIPPEKYKKFITTNPLLRDVITLAQFRDQLCKDGIKGLQFHRTLGIAGKSYLKTH
ncbi:MAG: hypothetical protein ACFFFG_18415 [Candidatus Thorarchaeota archaeon]